MLLYSTLGGQWTYGSRITYSFMPDGTNVAGASSSLFSTLNAKYPTSTWETQIEVAATLWENVTNVNLVNVTDGGQTFGTSGDQQGDSRFGDIRIGMVPLASGILAETFDPPPINGGTAAGDILFNSNVNWQIGSSYDLLTVAAHEFGHALGLGESSVSTAVMYGTYTGIKQTLTSDDITGIESLYGVRTADQFNTNGKSDAYYTVAANINSFISNDQLAIPGLENMTSAGSEWYYVTVPAGAASSMTITVQSAGLSSYVPHLQVYTSGMSLVGSANGTPDVFGSTIRVTDSSVTAGSSFYIRVYGAGGAGAIGTYGLLANFSTQSQSPIAPPNTVVPEQPDQGGGTSNDNAAVVGGGHIGTVPGSWWLSYGNGHAWSEGLGTTSTAATINPFLLLVNPSGSSSTQIIQAIDTLALSLLDTVLADWNAESQHTS
jgi:hypothetical protein